MTALEISRIKPASDEFVDLFSKVRQKDKSSIRDYLYWCTWREISNNEKIKKANRLKTLVCFMEEIPIRILIDG